MKELHSQSDAAKIQFRRRCKKEQRWQKARVEKFAERDSREEAGFHRRCEFRCFHDVLNSLVCRGPCICFNGVSAARTAIRRYRRNFGRASETCGAVFSDFMLETWAIPDFPSRLVHNFQKCEMCILNMISLHELPYKSIEEDLYTWQYPLLFIARTNRIGKVDIIRPFRYNCIR